MKMARMMERHVGKFLQFLWNFLLRFKKNYKNEVTKSYQKIFIEFSQNKSKVSTQPPNTINRYFARVDYIPKEV
jgi:hypothetical protein